MPVAPMYNAEFTEGLRDVAEKSGSGRKKIPSRPASKGKPRPAGFAPPLWAMPPRGEGTETSRLTARASRSLLLVSDLR